MRFKYAVSRKILAAMLAAALLAMAGCGYTEPQQTQPSVQTQPAAPEETQQQNQPVTEATEPENTDPALTTRVLGLAGLSLDEVSAVLGEYTERENFYWFDGGYVGYVFAYGTKAGNNYIQAPLSRLITNCPETLTVEDMQKFFPGGERSFDEMDEVYCFCWDYRDCSVVIFENADGTYTPESLFFYNCNDKVVEKGPWVKEEVFEILGMTKSQMDTFFGQVASYDAEFGCMPYTYQDRFVWAYMDDYTNGTCIGFYCPLGVIVQSFSIMNGEDLKQLMGDPYQDPWNGDGIYSTIYKGGQLRVFTDYTTEPGTFDSNSPVNFHLTGKDIYESDIDYWTNNSSLFYGQVTVYAQSATELDCAFEYSQLTPPNRIAETGRVKLTSTDGITYTATGVEDNWGSTLTVTVTMLEEAARITFEVTKVGEMANFCFGDFIAYQ